ncbi:MAG: DUF1018 domain-containing protein [Archaeoglobus sp.]|nr:DUF1018 domain-containing protein [Archaeoglobus sp.]
MKKELGLDDDLYRAILLYCAGVDSAKDLDQNGFQEVMRFFERMYPDRRVRKLSSRNLSLAGGLTERQLDYIYLLWEQITGFDRTKPEFRKTLYSYLTNHFSALRRFYSLPDIWNSIDSSFGSKIITGLRRIYREKINGEENKKKKDRVC